MDAKRGQFDSQIKKGGWIKEGIMMPNYEVDAKGGIMM